MDEFKEKFIDEIKNNEVNFKKFKEEVYKKDIIMCIGNSRSGKSTLINYLIGTPLLAQNRKIGTSNCIDKATTSDDGPTIGHGSAAYTASCSMYKMPNDTKQYIIDSPGLEDNRGHLQEILNSYYMDQVKNANTIKFVIVVDICHVTQTNIGAFLRIIEYIQQHFLNYKQFLDSFGFIFTKDSSHYLADEIAELLKEIILDEPELRCSKALVQNIVDNRNRIGLFQEPSTIGNLLPSEIDINLIGVINNTKEVDCKKLEIVSVVCDATTVFLQKALAPYICSTYFNMYTDRLDEKFKEYYKIYRYIYASYDEELESTKQSLEHILIKINHILSFQTSCLSYVTKGLQILTDNMDDFEFVVSLDKIQLLKAVDRFRIVQNFNETLKAKSKSVTDLIGQIDDELADRSKESFMLKVGAAVTAFATPSLVFPFIGGIVVGIAGIFTFFSHRTRYTKRLEERKTQNRN